MVRFATLTDSGRGCLRRWCLAAVQGSLLSSAQARQISIFTCVALAVFCLAPHRPIKALFVAPPPRARNISHLGGIRETTFRRGQTSIRECTRMTNPFNRGSSPGRARDSLQRSGSFKPGHKKRGGRKKGSRNVISPEHKRALLEAAHRVGSPPVVEAARNMRPMVGPESRQGRAARQARRRDRQEHVACRWRT